MDNTKSELQAEFDQARALLMSYCTQDDATEDGLLKMFTAVRELCPKGFDRLLVLLAASRDPRFREYGLADAVAILRDTEITSDVRADAERLLERMRIEDGAIEHEARCSVNQTNDVFYQAAVRLITKYANPTLEHVFAELAN